MNYVNNLHNLGDNDIQKLVIRIRKICRDQSVAFYEPIRHQLNALKGIYRAREEWRRFRNGKRKENEVKGSGRDVSKKLGSDSETELSLLLIVCLLESQSRFDPSLATATTRLLTNHFRNRTPNPAAVGSPKHLESLENMLRSWLQTSLCDAASRDGVEDIATALVTLTCAYASHSSIVRTIHVLKNVTDDANNIKIDVKSAIDGLLSNCENDAAIKIPEIENLSGITLFNSERHICSDKTSHCERRIKSVTCDGRHVFVTNDTGCKLVKVGTGKGNSIKNYVYSSWGKCSAGFSAAAQDLLIHRPLSFDENPGSRLCVILDKNSLDEIAAIDLPDELNLEKVNFFIIIFKYCTVVNVLVFFFILLFFFQSMIQFTTKNVKISSCI